MALKRLWFENYSFECLTTLLIRVNGLNIVLFTHQYRKALRQVASASWEDSRGIAQPLLRLLKIDGQK